nr:hypothetical protein [Tanacetum cinerariifolium]
MPRRHVDLVITDPKPPVGSYDEMEVRRLSDFVMKLHDIPEGVFVLSGLSRVWKSHTYDLIWVSWRFPFYSAPAAVGSAISEPTPDELTITVPDTKVLAKVEKSKKQKAFNFGTTLSQVGKPTRSASKLPFGGNHGEKNSTPSTTEGLIRKGFLDFEDSLLHLPGSQPMLKSSYKAEASVIISIPPLVGGVADVVVEIKGTGWSISITFWFSVGLQTTDDLSRSRLGFIEKIGVKDKQENDEIKIKPDKNEKHGRARQCKILVTIKKAEKQRKYKFKGPNMQTLEVVLIQVKDKGWNCNYDKDEPKGPFLPSQQGLSMKVPVNHMDQKCKYQIVLTPTPVTV